MKNDIQPLGRNVLVERDTVNDKTETGIYLSTTSDEKPQTGKVLAVGESEKIKVKKGQKIVFNRYGGTEITVGGKDYLIVKNDEILAILE